MPKQAETSERIRSAAGRTLFVTAYAAAAEAGDLPKELPRAPAGENWDDYAPETPESAKRAGNLLIDEIEGANQTKIGNLYKRASEDGPHLTAPCPENFGYCLAMEAIGSGVGWSDNHPDLGARIPTIETWVDCTGKKLTFGTSGL